MLSFWKYKYTLSLPLIRLFYFYNCLTWNVKIFIWSKKAPWCFTWCVFLWLGQKNRSESLLRSNLLKAELYLQYAPDLNCLKWLRVFLSDLTLFYFIVRVFKIKENHCHFKVNTKKVVMINTRGFHYLVLKFSGFFFLSVFVYIF